MNIFIVDANPINAARSLCDKHVVKMPLETTQLLSTLARHDGHDIGYKPTHVNHPCSLWLRQDRRNVQWLLVHGKALFLEYTQRYGKVHKSESVFDDLSKLYLSDYTGPFFNAYKSAPLCMPDEYKVSDVVQSYRNYYKHGKANILQWNHGTRPSWL